MKNILVILTFVAVFLASSCSTDNLEIPQKGVIPQSDFYKTEGDALSAITTCYSELARLMSRGLAGGQAFNYSPYVILYNEISDDIYAAGEFRADNWFGTELNEFRYTTQQQTITNMYRSLYGVIYSCNLLINSFDQNDPNVNIQRYVAEARVWRAWCYMMLAIGWGTPPLVTDVLGATSFPGNSEPGEVMDFVIKEYGEAAAFIPSKPSKTDKDATIRLCKEAVYAFQGKAQVYAGKYADAAKTLKEKVIDTNLYDLVPGAEMTNLFHKDGDYSVEKVFEFNVEDNSALGNNAYAPMTWQQANYWSWRADHFRGGLVTSEINMGASGGGWGGCFPTGEFARSLIANDGMDSYRRKAWIKTYHEVLYDLTYASDATTTPTIAEKRKDDKRGIQSYLYGCEGYFMWKRIYLYNDRCLRSQSYFEMNHVLMRYAEVLLLFAEAAQRSNQYTSEALAALNAIQNRAGSKHVSSSLTLDEIKNEKRFEMWLEGVRGIDLIRWGDAPTVLAHNGDKVPTFYDDFTGNDHGVWDDPTQPMPSQWRITWENYGGGGFKAGQHELFPYPFFTITRNPNIVQNPGW